MFIVGDNILETLLCDKCKRYLSVKPIKVYPNRAIHCGRCASASDAGVVSLFGVLAKGALFRCVNRFDGCNQLLPYSEVAEHEKQCKAAEHICPECPESFRSNSFGIFVHFKEIHSELLIQNTEEFMLELETDFQTAYLLRKNDLLFYLIVKFDINEELLTISTSYLGNEKKVINISLDFTLSSLDRKVKYFSVMDRGVSGIGYTLDPIKISLKIDDIFKKIVICKLILNTESFEKLLALPKGEPGIYGGQEASLAEQKITSISSGSKLDKLEEVPGFNFENVEGGVQDSEHASLTLAEQKITSGSSSSKFGKLEEVPAFTFGIVQDSKQAEPVPFISVGNSSADNQLKLTNKRSNDDLVDELVAGKYIKNLLIENAFRAVDRGEFAPPEFQENVYYRNNPWKSGKLHQSAPGIYAVALEALNLKRGDSFLNLGSGTGYLSTIAGVLLGTLNSTPNGGHQNVAVEIYHGVVIYAKEILKKLTVEEKFATRLGGNRIVKPDFHLGNCLKDGFFTGRKFDKIYCGAACPEQYQRKIESLLKVGGILVIPIGNQLLKIVRTTETECTSSKLLRVSFAPLIAPQDSKLEDEVVAKSAELLEATESTVPAKQPTDNSLPIKTGTFLNNNNTSDTTNTNNVAPDAIQQDLSTNVSLAAPIAPLTFERTPTIVKPLVTPRKAKNLDITNTNNVASDAIQQQYEDLSTNISRASPTAPSTFKRSPTIVKPLVTPMKTKNLGITIKNEVARSAPQQQAETLAEPAKELTFKDLFATPIKSNDGTDITIKNEVAKSAPQLQAEALLEPVKELTFNDLFATPIKSNDRIGATIENEPAKSAPKLQAESSAEPVKQLTFNFGLPGLPINDPIGVTIKKERAKSARKLQAEALAEPAEQLTFNNSFVTPIKTNVRIVTCEPQRSLTPPSISNGFTCPECGRVITSQIGMWSHRHNTHGVRSPQIQDSLSPGRIYTLNRTPSPTFGSFSVSPSFSPARSSSRGSGSGGGSGGGSCPECGRYISSSIGMWSHRHHTHGENNNLKHFC